MKKCLYLTLAFLASALLLASCMSDDTDTSSVDLQKGDPLPTFAVSLSIGDTGDWRWQEAPWQVTSASLRGKRSVIVFFNTGCPDCQEELPVVQELYDAVKGNANIELVCISREEGEESIRAYWQANGLTLPYSPQEDAAVFRLFASHTIPRIYIANATATITATFADNPKATLQQLKAALGI